MNIEPDKNPDRPKSVPQDRTLENIVTALNRGEALLKIVGDFSTAALQQLEVFNLSQLANPDTLTAMDIYDRPLAEVTKLLQSRKIQFNIAKNVTETEIHNLNNLGSMAWKIPLGSRVELLTHQDRVLGIRVIGEQKK
jgi:hypothetical protein